MAVRRHEKRQLLSPSRDAELAVSNQPQPHAATLIVARAPADGLGDQYQIAIRLDGELLGGLSPGETLTREIQPGSHRLLATNTLMRKVVAFHAAAGAQLQFRTRNLRGFGTDFFAAMGAGWLYVDLEIVSADAV
jgi:hypothetical protein